MPTHRYVLRPDFFSPGKEYVPAAGSSAVTTQPVPSKHNIAGEGYTHTAADHEASEVTRSGRLLIIAGAVNRPAEGAHHAETACIWTHSFRRSETDAMEPNAT